MINPNLTSLLNNNRHSLLRLLFIFASIFCNISHASNTSSLVIYNEESAYQVTFYEHLSTQLKTSAHSSFKTLLSDNVSLDAIKETQSLVIINLDKALSKKLVDYELDIPIFHTLITSKEAFSLSACLPDCAPLWQTQHFFVLDQPPARQLKLIQLVKPNTKEIGIIYSKQNSKQIGQYDALVKTNPSVKITGFLADKTNLRFMLNDIAKSSDIILAIPDSTIYSTTTLPQILLTSYRHQTPVIGFSKGFIKAGAISGIVSSLKQLAQQTTENIQEHLTHGRTISNGIIYPKYFDVISNRRVANSLNLRFNDDRKLTTQLQSDEIP